MKKLKLLSIALTLFAISTAAVALDLDGARAGKVLGEKNDGYVSVLKDSPDADALAKDINAKRTAEYQKISAENGQPVDVVAKLASKEIVKNLKAGSMYQNDGGAWVAK